MKSPASLFWAAAAAVTLMTLAPKLLRVPKSQTEAAAESTERLRRFLAPFSQAPLIRVQQKPPLDEWSGWRFAAGGCSALAFPSGQGGEFTAAARLHAAAGDRVQFLYRGAILETPPTTRVSIDYLTSRMVARRWPFYVVLIRPATCAGPLALPWAQL